MTPSSFRRTTVAAAITLVLTSAASAQVYRAEILTQPPAIRVESDAQKPETVRLLAALGKIESDLQLGMLFLTDELASPEGSHFTRPRKETLPGIKDGLAAAGIADLEPLLEKLEAGGEIAVVTATYMEAVAALAQARAALHPSTEDLILSIVEQARAVVDEINADGPTEVNNYRDAWAMLMVARSQMDLLLGDADPAVVKEAREIGMALDDLILSMPDPAVTAPVELDPTPISALVEQLQALAGAI